jgi:2-keto-4-pentenoate hydratase/2-oxohepta-3-ene-1,7-dioic acid hydratase in catechol pathway
MKLRRVLIEGRPVVAACDPGAGTWVALPEADVLALLAATPAERDAELAGADRAVAGDLVDLLPFEPRSLRAFSIYPAHIEQSGRVLAKRFFPKPAGVAIGAFEGVTRRTFPALKPKLAQPAMYVGNHTAVVADGATVAWPSHTEFLDYELELGFVLACEVRDATAAEGEAAIGGFFVVNDWSARDVQADEYRHGMFGPAVKSKSFATSLGSVVVTPDEVAGALRGAVRVNGATWSETSTAGAAFSLGELVAYASRGETLAAGDVFAMGTVPNGSGLELDRWVQPGDVVELELEALGTLTNTVGRR